MILRPVTQSDLNHLVRLVEKSGPGLTNLPQTKEQLLEKILSSEKSFRESYQSEDQHKQQANLYFFVLEDEENDQLAGCCGIISKVGLSQPFYSLRVMNLTHTSNELKYYEPVQVLQMVEEYRGDSEVMMLYLAPEYRKDGNGRMLSYSRFLFISQFINLFSENIIAEMRGCVDDSGYSAFWDNLGGRFIPLDFIAADKFNALGHFQFIADLMPKFPIYIRLLSEQAQAMIGSTHADTIPAVKLLEKEGFRNDGTVDVFDAGPTLRCPTKQLRTVRESKLVKIMSIKNFDLSVERPSFIVCKTELQDFRLTPAIVSFIDESHIIIDSEAAKRLQVQENDVIRVHKIF